MNQNRPVNLDLSTLKYPPMAIASILHRISGIVIFLVLPFMLYLLGVSLSSEQGFAEVIQLLTSPIVKLVVWGFLCALMYHVLAGIRHVFMDLGFGEEVNEGRRSAILVIVMAVVTSIILGIWIC